MILRFPCEMQIHAIRCPQSALAHHRHSLLLAFRLAKVKVRRQFGPQKPDPPDGSRVASARTVAFSGFGTGCILDRPELDKGFTASDSDIEAF